MMHSMHLAAMASEESGEELQPDCLQNILSIRSPAGMDCFFGNYRLFVAQIIGIVVTVAVAIVGTLVCLGIVRLFTELRVDEKEEKVGLDISQHGESAYPTFNGLDS